MSSKENLSEKITAKKARVGIVGMGYVGHALATLASQQGFYTLGFVRNPQKAEEINKEKKNRLKATHDASLLKTCDIILICVQTPILADKKPNLLFLENAVRQVSRNLKKGQLVVVESSVPVGTTRNIVLPILKKSGLKQGKDFFLAYSPERVDPGNKKFALSDIPKVVAGLDKNSKYLALMFYKSIIKKVVPVTSVETAEMVKLTENTFRLVNISFVNELADYTKALGIDIWEVIKACSTKPFGFLAHYPGPGVGGDCIPVVPYYILNDAKQRGINLKLIQQAGKINDRQPHKVVKRALEIISSSKIKNNKVLLIGASYKPDVSDTRESPAIRIWKILKRKNISVSYHDPHVPKINGAVSKELSKKTIGDHDMIIIVTNHNNISYNEFLNLKKPILDTRNVFKNGLPNVFRI